MVSGAQRMLDRWAAEVAAGRNTLDAYADYNAVTLQARPILTGAPRSCHPDNIACGRPRHGPQRYVSEFHV